MLLLLMIFAVNTVQQMDEADDPTYLLGNGFCSIDTFSHFDGIEINFHNPFFTPT